MSNGDSLGKDLARKFYDQEAKSYIQMYTSDYHKYPANLIRLNIIIKALKQKNVKTIIDCGCGTCLPMIKLIREHFAVQGFDFSEEMLLEGKKELENAGYSGQLICNADLENASTLKGEKFDAAIALGVFPHIINEAQALQNIAKMLNKDGLVFIEFRNDLFATYTLNKYSADFFLNRIIDLKHIPKELTQEVLEFYAQRLKVDKPQINKDNKIKYTDILAKYHNPLTIAKTLFEPNGFSVVKIYFYHYHALPPIFENKYPKLFRELSLEMENPDDWRGYLMASAFVVEAKKNDANN